MIYYIGNSKLFNSDAFTYCTPEESLIYLEEFDEIGLDLETTGFDPHTCKILTLQLGNKERQYVINAIDIDITKYYKKYIESRLIIGQNLKFDIRFLYKYNIIPTKAYDTYLAECILYNNDDREHRKGLDALSLRYCGIKLDKSIRGEIHKGLTDRVITYAAGDVEFLGDIKEKQLVLAEKLQVLRAIELDNLFVPVLAYIEYSGIKLDKDLWQKKINKNKEEIEIVKKELDNHILTLNVGKFIDRQLDLFCTDPKITINWNSSKQVIELFSILGIDTSLVEDGELKESVGAKHIQSQIDRFPIIKTYLKFKELQKDLSTYGENFYKHINRNTGRIHTNFNQLMNTGRMSSGGKDKQRRIDYINLQNIPADKDTRQCFVADTGNILVDCDYSGQEDIVFVNKSKETKLIDFYLDTTRKRDGHSFVAKMCFPKELANIPEEDVKKVRPDLRQKAKSAKFAMKKELIL